MNRISRHRTYIPLLLLCMAVAGCSQDETYRDYASGTDVRFDNTTVLVANNRTETRAISEGDPFNSEYAGLEASENTIYLTHEKPWGDIYLNMKVDNVDRGVTKYQPGTGTKGQLVSQEAGQNLKWENSTSTHQFHAWTIPEESNSAIIMNNDGKTGIVNFGPSYNESKKPLEYFIGTMTEPLTYKDNGLSVSMEFQHLVAKVCIRKLIRIKSDGSHSDVDNSSSLDYLSITFPDMPQTAKFDTGIDKNEFPSVAANDGKDDPKGVVVKERTFHLPPFNFEKHGKFEVTCYETEPDYLYMRTYYGHLKDISTLTELRAGEAIALDLILTDGKVTGVSVYIVDWNDVSDETISLPAKPGIYMVDDLKGLEDGNWDNYAVTGGNGKKVIYLYNNLTLSSDLTITIPEGYVFDGLGHNIKGNVTFNGEGTVRDLYVNGEPYHGSAGS